MPWIEFTQGSGSRNAISCTAFTPITRFNVFFLLLVYTFTIEVLSSTERNGESNGTLIKSNGVCDTRASSSSNAHSSTVAVIDRIVAHCSSMLLLFGLLLIKYKLIITCVLDFYFRSFGFGFNIISSFPFHLVNYSFRFQRNTEVFSARIAFVYWSSYGYWRTTKLWMFLFGNGRLSNAAAFVEVQIEKCAWLNRLLLMRPTQ